MKIISKIEIHPFTYFVLVLAIITGHFHDVTMLFILFFIHELGHIFTALFFHWKIEKIKFLPFGGVTIFQEDINRPSKEEWWIVAMGPLFQTLAYVSCCSFFNEQFLYYHLFFFGFNLLPIVPLDGSKIVTLILERFFSFSKSHVGIIYLSIFLTSLFCFYTMILHNLVLTIAFFFLFCQTWIEVRKHAMLCEKFFLERYLKSFSFKKHCFVSGVDPYLMKRDYKHLFYENGTYYTEKEVLKEYFDG